MQRKKARTEGGKAAQIKNSCLHFFDFKTVNK
jgi:hypothetical protein